VFAARVRQRISGAFDVFRWLAPALARLTLGLVFLQSGIWKLQDLARSTAFFAKLGIPAAPLLSPFVGVVELVGGSLLFVGFLTRPATIPLIAILSVAIPVARMAEIHSLTDLLITEEFLLIIMCLWLGAFGAGPLSVDSLIEQRLSRRAPK
jgi:putative oxidoreductase